MKVYPSWLDSATTSTAGPSGPVMRDWCNVFYSADSEPVAGEHSDSGLRSGTRGPSAMSTWGSYSNVKRSNPFVFCGLGCCCSGLHRSVRRPLKSISFNVLSSCASGDCLSACEVCYVNHRVVEGGVDVGYSPSVRRCLSLLRHTRIT